MKSVHEIIADFDAIAGALEEIPARQVLTPAERALLEHVPADARLALDVGCGDGVVSRALARRGLRVFAIDVSPRMTALARARTPDELDVRYLTRDFMTELSPSGAFDAVVSINMVHHFALVDVVARLAATVAPGGVLLIQDVEIRSGMRYLAANVAAVIGRRIRQFVGHHHESRAVTALYERHGKDEAYLAPAEVEAAYKVLLPGVRIEHHLEWRYSAIWSRPTAA